MKIIMLSGHARAGKDTFANFFMEAVTSNAVRYAFADALKDVAKDLYGWSGEKDKEGRKLLIDVGQIGRGFWGIEKISIGTYNDMRSTYKLSSDQADLLHERFNIFKKNFTPSISFWVDIVYRKILWDMAQQKNDPIKYAIITDWRFQSEYHNLKLYFGADNITTVRINRKVPLIDDISEKDLDNFSFDYTIPNNSKSLDTYRKTVSRFVEEITPNSRLHLHM